jgi:valyl-tRNA synthetase
VDIELEVSRITGEIKKVKIDAEKSSKKISNIDFLKKAPEEIVNKEKEKLAQFSKVLEVLNEQLEKIKNIRK